jgi:hypothetical protein
MTIFKFYFRLTGLVILTIFYDHFIAGSSKGRTPGSGPGCGGSNPPPAAKVRSKKKNKRKKIILSFLLPLE